ncbi:MAG: cyclic nucleotide-binding domain-containing protein [Deltaproteobacteria bacterium]|nr:cyclic nucleotide-binding domain-containing protein [Deltaproteobacteria bacterium]MBW2019307.1 cyclic nucleotide-binding domain-containing protein [Deltaproteobacteria bacterium]MBW2074355.1 cyclic nucleotide-binding domain-containing protein [Deltaproteobacteria bacterium]
MTIGLGFSVLLFSSFVPTIIFGFLMVVTVTSALVGDLFILAAILLKIQLVTLWDLLRLKLGKDPQKGIPLFNGLSRAQVHYLLMAGSLRKYNSGDILFRKGEVSDSMYAVISGMLDVVDALRITDEYNNHGTRRLITTIKKGDVVGEMGMIRRCQRSATVIATAPTELLEINDKMIKRLHWLYPPTAQNFFFNLMTIMCNRLEKTTKCSNS